MAVQMNAPSLTGLTGIARRLVADGDLGEADARKAVDDAQRQKIPLAVWLTSNGIVNSSIVAHALSAEFGMPLMDASALDLSAAPLKLVKEDLISKHKAMPLFKRGN